MRIPGGGLSLSLSLCSFSPRSIRFGETAVKIACARGFRGRTLSTRLARETRLTPTAAAESGERIHGGGGGGGVGRDGGGGSRRLAVVGRTAAAALFDTPSNYDDVGNFVAMYRNNRNDTTHFSTHRRCRLRVFSTRSFIFFVFVALYRVEITTGLLRARSSRRARRRTLPLAFRRRPAGWPRPTSSRYRVNFVSDAERAA